VLRNQFFADRSAARDPNARVLARDGMFGTSATPIATMLMLLIIVFVLLKVLHSWIAPIRRDVPAPSDLECVLCWKKPRCLRQNDPRKEGPERETSRAGSMQFSMVAMLSRNWKPAALQLVDGEIDEPGATHAAFLFSRLKRQRVQR
jgi:hypothetical protein